ncbi:hypothetical protein M8997_005850 [Phyllobacterium sp. 21LDTY02-6]|jgi:hypothetical protein|uniref:hypothetical protein n=1 Tax=unclassified Phyllobacterium TaxID=2638441 RepID=UPI00201FD02B|nr:MULTISPECIES: hypothetical protein [unclassified Phyllobacterium]MCO4316700.1 hypothetical protein [Phyllobacterium sp. 21LDTY02-6]MCX8281727.1 hypothetical protein [Phyllobacterium sp. 0TCS1.6C]MCX8294837.1 hypothetical protein [Phyllobacterium sp. 0TCS1.6A]
MGNDPVNQKNSIDNVRYIQQLLGELRAIARASQKEMLAYLIEIAYIESCDELRKDLEDRNSTIRKRN